MAPGKDGERRAAAGEAGAAIFAEHAPAPRDGASVASANGSSRGFGSVHVCRAGFAGRGTPFVLPTKRHTLASPSNPRQGLGSHS